MAGNAKRGPTWVRFAVDGALALLFVAVMATALVQEAPHEYLGIALFVVAVAHVALNRTWFTALFRGRYNAVRVLRLATVIGLIACIVGQVASSLVLSKFAFGFLPALLGASWARRVHMLCSYWSFVFAFAHVGLHAKNVARLVGPKGPVPAAAVWVVRIVALALSCYGVYAFIQMGMGAYLLGQVQFAFADYATPLALACARYAAIAVLIASAFYYLRRAIETFAKRN